MPSEAEYGFEDMPALHSRVDYQTNQHAPAGETVPNDKMSNTLETTDGSGFPPSAGKSSFIHPTAATTSKPEIKPPFLTRPPRTTTHGGRRPGKASGIIGCRQQRVHAGSGLHKAASRTTSSRDGRSPRASCKTAGNARLRLSSTAPSTSKWDVGRETSAHVPSRLCLVNLYHRHNNAAETHINTLVAISAYVYCDRDIVRAGVEPPPGLPGI